MKLILLFLALAKLSEAQNCAPFTNDATIEGSLKAPRCRIMSAYDKFRSAMYNVDVEFRKPMTPYYNLVRSVRKLIRRCPNILNNTVITKYFDEMGSAMQQFIGQYVFSQNDLTDILTKNLQPFFVQHQSYQLSFYTKVASNIGTFKEKCEPIYKDSMIQEISEQTTEIEDCFNKAQDRLRLVRTPFFRTLYSSFSRGANPLIQDIDQCNNMKDCAKIEEGIVEAIGGTDPVHQLLNFELKDAQLRCTNIFNGQKDKMSTCLSMAIKPIISYTEYESCVVKGPPTA